MYKILLASFAVVLIILLAYALIKKNKVRTSSLLTSCFAIFLLTIMVPLQIIMNIPLFSDTVELTALRSINGEPTSGGITLKDIYSNNWFKGIRQPISGEWAWRYGYLQWWPELSADNDMVTDKVVLQIPVGFNRYLIFESGPYGNCVDVSYNGNTDTLNLYNDNPEDKIYNIPDHLGMIYYLDRLLRVAMVAVSEVLIILLVQGINRIISRSFLRKLQKYKKEFFVFGCCLMNIVRLAAFPGHLDYQNSYYFMGYEGGFTPRSILGQVCIRLLGPFVDTKTLAIVKLILLCVFFCFASFLFVKAIKTLNDRNVRIMFLLLFFALPFHFLQIVDDLRIDFYLTFFFLIAVLLINIGHGISFIPLICALLMLNNESSCFFYVLPILALLLFEYCRKKDVSYLVSMVGSFLITCVIALHCLAKEQLGAMTGDEAFYHALYHTNTPLNLSAFRAEKMGFSAHMYDNTVAFGQQYPVRQPMLLQAAIWLVMMMPFFLLQFILWKGVYRKYRERGFSSRRDKLIRIGSFAVLVLSTFGSVITMIMGYDFCRFYGFSIIATEAIILSVICQEKLSVRAEDFYCFRKIKNGISWSMIQIIIYGFCFGYIDCWTPGTPIISKLSTIILNLLGRA